MELSICFISPHISLHVRHSYVHSGKVTDCWILYMQVIPSRNCGKRSMDFCYHTRYPMWNSNRGKVWNMFANACASIFLQHLVTTNITINGEPVWYKKMQIKVTITMRDSILQKLYVKVFDLETIQWWFLIASSSFTVSIENYKFVNLTFENKVAVHKTLIG